MLILILGYVEGAARREVEAARAEEHTGKTDEEWWSAGAPLLETVSDAGRFPTAARVGAAYDPERAFAFGLGRVLDGIEALVRSRLARPDGR